MSPSSRRVVCSHRGRRVCCVAGPPPRRCVVSAMVGWVVAGGHAADARADAGRDGGGRQQQRELRLGGLVLRLRLARAALVPRALGPHELDPRVAPAHLAARGGCHPRRRVGWFGIGLGLVWVWSARGVLCRAVPCCAVLCCAVLCYAVLCCAVLLLCCAVAVLLMLLPVVGGAV